MALFDDLNEEQQALEQRLINEFEARHKQELQNDIKELMESKSFRRYLWHVLSHCRVMDKSMDVNASIMAFREGQRDVGIMIMQDIMEASPTSYEVMRAEHTMRAEEEEAQIRKIKEVKEHE